MTYGQSYNGVIKDGKRHGIWEIFFCSSEFAIIKFLDGKACGLEEIHQRYDSNFFEVSEINFYLT